ncbi:hypothetical protein IC582_012909 [Cucumis melo]
MLLIQLLLQEPKVIGSGTIPQALRRVNTAVPRHPLATTLLHRLEIQCPLVKE